MIARTQKKGGQLGYKYMVTQTKKHRLIIRAMRKKPFLARFCCTTPVFCATKMVTASPPLSPNELANPSMQMSAVKAEMQAVPMEFTAPWTSSFLTALKETLKENPWLELL